MFHVQKSNLIVIFSTWFQNNMPNFIQASIPKQRQVILFSIKSPGCVIETWTDDDNASVSWDKVKTNFFRNFVLY